MSYSMPSERPALTRCWRCGDVEAPKLVQDPLMPGRDSIRVCQKCAADRAQLRRDPHVDQTRCSR
jgi:hypothetical protein